MKGPQRLRRNDGGDTQLKLMRIGDLVLCALAAVDPGLCGSKGGGADAGIGRIPAAVICWMSLMEDQRLGNLAE